MKPNAPGAQPAAPAAAVDVPALVAEVKKQIPANLADIFDKIVLSGMRIMFDQGSHEMMLAELDKPGPLEQRLSNGVISLMYMLWQKSNKTIPPQLMIPATVTLTMRAFEFLQESKDPEATKEMLGQAVELAIQGVLERFKGNQEGNQMQPDAQPQNPGNMRAPADSAQPPAQPGAQPTGLLGSMMGGRNV